MEGYAGRMVDIDLSNGKISVTPIDAGLMKQYIGGRGLCSRMLYDSVAPGTDPFAPDNAIVVATGPLVGTLGPSTGRFTVSAISPLTGILGDANSGGHFGPELKYAGYDAIRIRGRSKTPCFISIQDGDVAIGDAGGMWEIGVIRSEGMLKEHIGDQEAHALVIGPAGENLVRYAAVMNDAHRAAGRCGIGAVFGSKRLKGIVVRGTGAVEIHDTQGYADICAKCFEAVYNDPVYPTLSEVGTPFLMDSAQNDGGLATRNNQEGVYEDYGDISQKKYTDMYKLRSFGCFSCPIHCANISVIKKGDSISLGGGPEYESMVCLGSKCGITSLDTIIEANNLCNELGMDTISCGDSVAFAMELFEKGILGDTYGSPLGWGDDAGLLRLIQDIAYARGLGEVLCQGVKRAAEHIGRGAEKYALHVKGMEVPAFDGRAAKGFALGWAVSTRGADHLRALPNFELLGFSPKEAKKRFGSQHACDPYEERGKAQMVVWHENYSACIDSAEMCKYAAFSTYAILPDMLATLLNAATGMGWDEKGLLACGERIMAVEKIFNISLAGPGRDTLPSRFISEPLPGGPAKGNTVDLDTMLDGYYSIRGWDSQGVPSFARCRDLGLGRERERLGIDEQ